MKKITSKMFLVLSAVLILVPFYGSINRVQAQVSTIRTIIFPVIGKVSYSDDFGAPRADSTGHHGNDIMGTKLLPLVSAVDGTIILVNYPEATWGYSVTIKDSDGYTYHYIHMNNDNPGTDDGHGDGMHAYAPDIQVGNKVVKGQLLGYMGDSGNAETTQAHLHFEIRFNGEAFSPYQSLQNATKITSPADYPKLDKELLPYENFGGGTNVAVGNLDKDSAMEYVTGPGRTGGPLVKVLEKDGTMNTAFYAYGTNFTGGIDVAVGDIDGDGVGEIITSPGPTGGPHIKVFKADGTLLKEFMAYADNFGGGVHVSTSDLDSNGKWEVITAPASGGGPHVKIWDVKIGATTTAPTVRKELMAYDANLQTGIDVAGFDGGFVTGVGPGGAPQVKVWDENAQMQKEFFAYDGLSTVGLRVSVGDALTSNSGKEIVVAPATNGGPHVMMFDMEGTQVFSDLVAFEPWWRGGYDIAAFKGGAVITSMGGRRTSLRQVATTTVRDTCRRYCGSF